MYGCGEQRMCVSLSLRILGLIYKKAGSFGSRCWGPVGVAGKKKEGCECPHCGEGSADFLTPCWGKGSLLERRLGTLSSLHSLLKTQLPLQAPPPDKETIATKSQHACWRGQPLSNPYNNWAFATEPGILSSRK